MKMIRFRVQNYKNVNDTDWINCSDITSFVGKNESGKSAIFRGLSKLNPSDKETYDGLKEFPRNRYTIDFNLEDWPVSTVEFKLSKKESQEIREICSYIKKVSSITCTRHYSGKLSSTYNPSLKIPDRSNKRYLSLLKKWHAIIESSVYDSNPEQIQTIKTNLLPVLQSQIDELATSDLEKDINPQIVDNVRKTIMNQINLSWAQSLFKNIITDNDKLQNNLEIHDQLALVNNWINKQLPLFVYFEEYNVIDSAIHIPNFIRQLNQDPLNPKLRTTKCLFEQVGLDLNTISKLDPSKAQETEKELRRLADTRAILMSAASNAMT